MKTTKRKRRYPLTDITLPELQPLKKLHGLAKDLTGRTFGRLTCLWPVAPPAGSSPRQGVWWLCVCPSCSTLKVAKAGRLVDGGCTSCGCRQREQSSIYWTAFNAKRAKARFPGMKASWRRQSV